MTAPGTGDEKVLVRREGTILIVTIHRPQARNAIDRATSEAIARAMDELDGDASLSLGILTGAGAHFCIGYALARMETVTAARMLLDRFGSLEAVGNLPPLRIVGPSRFTSTLPVRRAQV